MNNMEYTIKDIIKSFDILDWCMVALIIVNLAIVHWYAYQYDIPQLLSGVVIGIPIGALAMGLGMSARDHKEAAERKGQE
jgi:hypothetical protein